MAHHLESIGKVDPMVPLQNLSAVRSRMDSLHRFLSESVNRNTLIGKHKMEMVSVEISTAIQQIILNGAALLASSTTTTNNISSIPSPPDPVVVPKSEEEEEGEEIPEKEEALDREVVEIDAVELLAEHVHFCDRCGKGFKRDANLRMHMRAHGNQFKTIEALAKPPPDLSVVKRTNAKFSCPYKGCNRNKKHNKFRPLKSVICVRNHFKRSHCPKLYSCERCNKKSFSVVSDLKSHLKHCGESRWKCTCGTSFSRKDKLFGHMALFEGHMPAMVAEKEEEEEEEEKEDNKRKSEGEEEDGLFDGLLDGFGSIIDGYTLQDVWASSNYGGGEIEGFYGGNFWQ